MCTGKARVPHNQTCYRIITKKPLTELDATGYFKYVYKNVCVVSSATQQSGLVVLDEVR